MLLVIMLSCLIYLALLVLAPSFSTLHIVVIILLIVTPSLGLL